MDKNILPLLYFENIIEFLYENKFILNQITVKNELPCEYFENNHLEMYFNT